MTSVPFKAFALGAALGLVVAVAPSCGSSALACDASTCSAGCCANGICLAGTAVNACGKGGSACNTCSTGQSCTAGSCGSTFTGGGQGGGSGGGGGTMVTCMMSQCKKDNMCFPGTAADSCGTGGTACAVCTASQECKGNACVAKVVDSGTPVVDSGTPITDAGMNNCSPTTCPAGCCLNNMCQNGDQNSACGTSGIMCAVCTGQTCDRNACTSTPVDAGMVDSGVADSGTGTVDSGTVDSGTIDSGMPVDAGMPVTCNPSVVISQVYGGGSGSAATFKTDFVELHNRTAATVDIGTWSLQYSSASLKPDGGAPDWQVATLTGTIAANAFFLVGLSSGGDGGTLTPAPDFSPTNALTMSATDGKIALVASVTPLMMGCPGSSSVVDMVGYGTGAAICSEATPATVLSKVESLTRKKDSAPLSCVDTNNNASDFVKGTPAPRNAASPASACTCTQ